MKKLLLFIHGKGGNIEEANAYKSIFNDYDVVGFDYQSNDPWHAKEEFPLFFDRMTKNYNQIEILGSSIGAYFCMMSLNDKSIHHAYFISPIVNMKELIETMMKWANVTIEQLEKEKIIPVPFGDDLNYEYYTYACNHPIEWTIPTSIVYGENDNLTPNNTIKEFANTIQASLTIMEKGEHWFHTKEQLQFINLWLKKEVEK